MEVLNALHGEQREHVLADRFRLVPVIRLVAVGVPAQVRRDERVLVGEGLDHG